MSYTPEQFKADVIAECIAIKEHATQEERNNLVFSIDAQDPDECIYGRLTGNCRSERAKELINRCCVRTVDNCRLSPSRGIESAIDNISTVKVLVNDASSFFIEYLSALEAYIMLPGAKVTAIQSFLLGQTETLEL